MSVYQRVLKILCVVLIIFAACLTLVGVLILSVFAFGAAGELVIEGYDAGWQYMVLTLFGTFCTVTGIASVVAGALGLHCAKKPESTMPFIVISSILIGVSLVCIVIEAVRGQIGGDSLITLLMPLLILSLALACAVQIRRGHARGIIAQPQEKGQKLGFLRVIQVLFAINIVATLVSCAVVQSSDQVFGFNDILDLANLVFDGMCFWLIMQRSKATRWWVIGFSLFNIVVGTVFNVATGQFDLWSQLWASAFDIVLLLYFCFAKRPREVLTQEFTVCRVHQMAVEAWDLYKPKTWSFWRSMIIYFCLFSIVGHWMEAGFCLLIKWGIVPGIYDPTSGIWRDYLNPFPVYGFGMVACAVLLYPLKNILEDKLGGIWKPLLASFIVNTLVCSAIELTLGLAQNMPDANGVYPLWDYSTMPFNFMGQICLQNSLLFGVVATLITWVVFPVLQRVYVKLPEDMRKSLFVIVVVFYAIVLCIYVVNI